MVIGGVNLLPDTRHIKEHATTQHLSNMAMEENEDTSVPSGNAFHVSGIALNSYSGFYLNYDILNTLALNGIYTLSFYAKSAKNNRLMVPVPQRQKIIYSTLTANITDVWAKYCTTYEYIDKTGNAFIFYIDSGDFDVSISSLKLERGTVATDWTPAPEDYIALEARVKALEEKLKS